MQYRLNSLLVYFLLLNLVVRIEGEYRVDISSKNTVTTLGFSRLELPGCDDELA